MSSGQENRGFKGNEPPPAYESQPPPYPSGVSFIGQQPQNVVVIEQQVIVGGANSLELNCPFCKWRVFTEVETITDNSAQLITAAILCIIGCWPCCLIPFCIPSEPTFVHRCPNCKNVLGKSQ